MQKAMVSIIVPVYNQEKYLETSIPALLAQEYTNIEIILVNDGSTDNSDSIMERYAEIDARIKIVDKVNGGLVDATLVGIHNANGEFIAFVDPDDRVGTDFILNFMSHMDENCDFVSMGFYYDNCGELSPYILSEDKWYTCDDLIQLSEEYLMPQSQGTITNILFFSRWNKLYRTECVKNTAKMFCEYKNVSLGEDSIFTYLMLRHCNSGRTLRMINSYYYNVANQDSMMKCKDIESHLNKARVALSAYNNMLKKYDDSNKQGYILYFFLLESIYQRALQQDKYEFFKLYNLLQDDSNYKSALKIFLKHKLNLKKKLDLIMRFCCISPKLYYFFSRNILKSAKKVKEFIEDINFASGKLFLCGMNRTRHLLCFRTARRRAFIDIQEQMPNLEERISPFLEEYLGKKTNFDDATIEKNVFVFWWDGFENAPNIVKRCLQTVRIQHSDCNVIEISKDNYLLYTDIHQELLEAFKRGDISIQTFSDILRFNLLKNNGGVWIDATIFFCDKFDLLGGLQYKSIESVCFATSGRFLRYKGNECSWSGYFFASRKNSVFVQAMNKIFEEYYLKYGTYSIYFFIDAALMVCKLNYIDDSALDKIQKNSGDMFLLSKLLDLPYAESCMRELKRIPQKLAWQYNSSVNNEKSFYDEMF